MPKQRPLGSRQIDWLGAIEREGNGRWYERCGFVWGTNSETMRLTLSLEKRGMLKRSTITARASSVIAPVCDKPYGRTEWHITEEGLIALMKHRVNSTLEGRDA